MRRFWIPLLLFSSLLTGCVATISPYSRTAPPEQEVGYVFGEFKLQGFFPDKVFAGIEIVGPGCPSGCVLSFFEGQGAVYPVALQPGTYHIHELVLKAGMVPKRQEFPASMLSQMPWLAAPIRVEAGKVIYLGSFVANGVFTPNRASIRLAYMYYKFDDACNRLSLYYPEFNGSSYLSTIPAVGVEQ